MVWALLVVLAGIPWASAADNPLLSPWDIHPVAATDAAFTCPAAPQLPHDFSTNSYYTDRHHSVVDPVLKKKYEDSVAGVEDFSRAVVKAADAFQTTGSRAAAQCVTVLLESAAKQKALAGTMDGHQAFYVQKWNLGSWAVAYLKVRGSGLVSEDQNKSITAWMNRVAEQSKGYCQQKRRPGTANDAQKQSSLLGGIRSCSRRDRQ
jgi:poly(beta-D-mannuronate) lyase